MTVLTRESTRKSLLQLWLRSGPTMCTMFYIKSTVEFCAVLPLLGMGNKGINWLSLSNRPKETATATTRHQTIHLLSDAAWCLLMRTTITNRRERIAAASPRVHSTAGTTRLWWRRNTRTPTRTLISLTATADPQVATARTPGTGCEETTGLSVNLLLQPAAERRVEYYTHFFPSMCSTSS